MSAHDELRDLLHRVVPDAPAPEPAGLARAGRRARVRGRVAAVGAAVALVALAASVVPRVLPQDDPTPEVAAFDPPSDPVYDAVPCPAELPSLESSNKTLPDLDHVVAVRYCGDAMPYGRGSINARGASFPATPDALVAVVPDFVAAVRALPVPDPDRCALVDGLSSRAALAMLLDDGSTVLVGRWFCGDNILAGHKVDADAVVLAFLNALDMQRNDSTYGIRVDLSCETRQTSSPAAPGRERVISAIECPETGPSRPLDDAALALLQDAWDHPDEITHEPNDHDENTCTELSESPRTLRISTDRGDVTSLYASPCGYLVHDGWLPGVSTQIPVTLEELGLA